MDLDIIISELIAELVVYRDHIKERNPFEVASIEMAVKMLHEMILAANGVATDQKNFDKKSPINLYLALLTYIMLRSPEESS